LTAERFLPDPFAADGGRLYRTGDVARVRGDGELEFVGRVDEQLKLRGFRVEPGEVEAALRRHPGVREAAVVARPGPGGEPRLDAYLVAADGAPGHGELRAFLAQTLPEYMLPAAYVTLERLPLTANGKLDRQALPAPQPERPPDGRYRPPRSPLEQLLADSFGELLELKRVGRDDNFFQLGGHSLLAARLAAKLRQSLQLDLPLRTLFQHPTPAQLAVAVETSTGTRVDELVGSSPVTS
jgi:hypothetical protein